MLPRKEFNTYKEVKEWFYKNIRVLFLVLLVFSIFCFINHNFINTEEDIDNEIRTFSIVDVKDIILLDYKSANTVYYKIINTTDKDINILTTSSEEDDVTVYCYTLDDKDNLIYKMTFTSSEITATELINNYDGVMK